jgi:prepilin-type N-terminal cleavage/methylation domain-containing protein
MNSSDNTTTVKSAIKARPARTRRLAGLAQSCPGMTLIELVIGLAIASLVSGAALISIHEILTASAIANDTQLSVSQVRAAEHWMTRDILSAQDVTLGGGSLVTLTWTDVDGGNHRIMYSLEAMSSGSLYNLERAYTDPDEETTTLVVASQIDAAQTSATLSDSGAVQVTIVATARTHTATRTFDAAPRSD